MSSTPPSDMANGLYLFANQVTPLWNWQLDYNFAHLFSLTGGGLGNTLVAPFNVTDSSGGGLLTVTPTPSSVSGVVTVAPGSSGTAGTVLQVDGAVNHSAMIVAAATNTAPGAWVAEFHSAPASAGPDQNGVLIQAGSGRDSTFTVTNSSGGAPLFNIFGDGSGSLGPYPNQLVWNAAGNFTLTGNATLPGGGSGGASYLSQLLDVSLSSQTNGQVLTWNSSNSRWTNTTVLAPPITLLQSSPAATTLTVEGAAGYPSLVAAGSSVSGQSQGLYVNGGFTSADYALSVVNYAQTQLFRLRGDGSGVLGPAPNQLIWDTAGHFTLTGTATLPGTALASLTDVTITSPAAGQVLTWNGTTSRWVNQTPPSPALAGLTDVTITSPALNQVLAWNGTRWVNQTPTGGSAGSTVAPFSVTNAAGTSTFLQVGANGVTTLDSMGGSGNNTTLVINCNDPTLTNNAAGIGIEAPFQLPGAWPIMIWGTSAAAGCSNGLQIQCGTNASDSPLWIKNAANNVTFMQIKGDGTGLLGASANNMTWNANGFTFTSTNPAVPPLTFVVPPSTTAGNWLWRIGGPGSSGSSAGCSNGLVIAAGTNASDYSFLVQNDGSAKTYFSVKGDGSGALGPAPNQLVWNSTGAFTLTGSATLPGGGGGSGALLAPVTITPGSGTSLAITGSSNVNVMTVTRGTANTAAGSWLGTFQSSGTPTAGMSNGVLIQAGTNAADSSFIAQSAAGGINFLNVRGDGLTVHRYTPLTTQNMWKFQIGGGASGDSPGCSNGIYVGAGTNNNDVSIWVQNDAGTATYLQIFGDGSGAIGPAPNQMTWTSAGVFSMTGSATAPHAALSASPDIAINNLQDGQTLVWNAASSTWINATPAGGGGAGYLAQLLDVNFSGASARQSTMLNWDKPTGKWVDLGAFWANAYGFYIEGVAGYVGLTASYISISGQAQFLQPATFSSSASVASTFSVLGTSTFNDNITLTNPLANNIVGLGVPIAFSISSAISQANTHLFVSITMPLTIPASFTGSRAISNTFPAANVTYTISKVTSSGGNTLNWTQIGAITWSTSSINGVFSGTGGSLAAGDILVLSPAVDAGLVQVGVTIYATRA